MGENKVRAKHPINFVGKADVEVIKKKDVPLFIVKRDLEKANNKINFINQQIEFLNDELQKKRNELKDAQYFVNNKQLEIKELKLKQEVGE